MACTIERKRIHSYRVPQGKEVTLCFTNDDGTARLVSAEIEVGKPLPIDNDSCVSFSVGPGTLTLLAVVISPIAYQVTGKCEDGTPTNLEDEDPNPEGDPVGYGFTAI